MYYYYPVKYDDIPLVKKQILKVARDFAKQDLGLDDYFIVPVSQKGDRTKRALKSTTPITGSMFWHIKDANFIVIDQQPEQLIKTVLHEAWHRWQSIHYAKTKTNIEHNALEKEACDYESEAYNRFYYSQAAGAIMRHLQSFSR